MNMLSDQFASDMLTGDVVWTTMTVRMALVDGAYVFDPAGPVYPPAESLFALSEPLTGLAVAAGWAKAEPAFFSSVLDNSLTASAGLLVSGAAVLAYIPTVTGLPFSGHSPFWVGWQPAGVFRP